MPAIQPSPLRGSSRQLANIFGDPAARPAGKLILSFTKDYLAEVKQLLRDAGLEGVASERFLQTLSRADIIEAIRLSPDLRRHHQLQLEPGLPELIADQLNRGAWADPCPDAPDLAGRDVGGQVATDREWLVAEQAAVLAG